MFAQTTPKHKQQTVFVMMGCPAEGNAHEVPAQSGRIHSQRRLPSTMGTVASGQTKISPVSLPPPTLPSIPSSQGREATKLSIKILLPERGGSTSKHHDEQCFKHACKTNSKYMTADLRHGRHVNEDVSKHLSCRLLLCTLFKGALRQGISVSLPGYLDICFVVR